MRDRRQIRLGGVVVSGVNQHVMQDIYHRVLSGSWRKFFALCVTYYLSINIIFAFLYLAGGDNITNARPGSFEDTFFFSVQTICTIGYGVLVPKNTYAHTLVATESLLGLISFAIMTGLAFSKLARPMARVMFSDVAVTTLRDGVPSLMFRTANERSSQIVEANIRVTLVYTDTTKEGELLQRMVDIPLVRNSSSVFLFSWTVLHSINEKSPIFNWTNKTFEEKSGRFVVSLTGIDAISGQTVHRQHTYFSQDLKWNAKFVDILRIDENGARHIDLAKFHLWTPA